MVNAWIVEFAFTECFTVFYKLDFGQKLVSAFTKKILFTTSQAGRIALISPFENSLSVNSDNHKRTQFYKSRQKPTKDNGIEVRRLYFLWFWFLSFSIFLLCLFPFGQLWIPLEIHHASALLSIRSTVHSLLWFHNLAHTGLFVTPY